MRWGALGLKCEGPKANLREGCYWRGRKGRRWMEGDGLGKEEQEEFQRVTHGRNSRSIKEPHLVSI